MMMEVIDATVAVYAIESSGIPRQTAKSASPVEEAIYQRLAALRHDELLLTELLWVLHRTCPTMIPVYAVETR
jgi:hypothetical protein